MLRDRNTRRFLLGSLQVFGGVEDSLLELAQEILRFIPTRRAKRGRSEINAEEFARRAESEIAWYHARSEQFSASVRVTGKVAGVMVSRGRLLIARDTTVPEERVDALIQHEIGTHLLSYYNGLSQPFRQLSSGLAGYDELHLT